MTRKYVNGRRLGIGLAAGLGIVGMTVTPAISQQAEEEIMEEIVVEAPIVRREAGRIEMSRRVSYADLDLSKRADVTELEARIKTMAKDICEKLDEMFPIGRRATHGGEVQQCTRKAIKGTEEQVEAAITAAEAVS